MKFGNAIDVSLFLKEKLESDIGVSCVIASSINRQDFKKARKNSIVVGIYPISGNFSYYPDFETEEVLFHIFVLGKNSRGPDKSFLGEISAGVLQAAMRVKDVLNGLSPVGNLKNVVVREWEMIEDEVTDAICACKITAFAEIVRPKTFLIKEDYYE